MAEPTRITPPNAIDVAVQETLDLCGGDAMNALRIALIATAFLEAEIDRLLAEISAGSENKSCNSMQIARSAPGQIS